MRRTLSVLLFRRFRFFRSLNTSCPWNPVTSPLTLTPAALSDRTHANAVCDGSLKKSPLCAFAEKDLLKSER